jgi:hypothetical protein
MKTRGVSSKKHIDREQVKMREKLKQTLRDLMLVGDEEGYVKLLKELSPDLTPAELVSLVRRFREERRNVQ